MAFLPFSHFKAVSCSAAAVTPFEAQSAIRNMHYIMMEKKILIISINFIEGAKLLQYFNL